MVEKEINPLPLL